MKGDKIFSQHLLQVKEAQKAVTLFGEDDLPEVKSNGRDAELIAARNIHIMYRYHYHVTIMNLNWPTVLDLLSRQFYLSVVTINKIVTDNTVLRRQIINENPSVKDMEKKFLVF